MHFFSGFFKHVEVNIQPVMPDCFRQKFRQSSVLSGVVQVRTICLNDPDKFYRLNYLNSFIVCETQVKEKCPVQFSLFKQGGSAMCLCT